MAISQRQLADQLRVSNMTVSRALRGESGINAKTRDRILVAARRAGLPLPPSQSLKAKRELLHILCANAPEGDNETPYHSRLLNGLRRGAAECAAELINCPMPPDNQWPLIVSRQQVDGTIVIWGDEHNPMPHADCPVPVTFVFYGPPHADIVDADNFEGGFQLGRRLAALGHRRVAYLGTGSRVCIERLSGLRTGLAAADGDCPPEFTLTNGDVLRVAPDLLATLLDRTGFLNRPQRPFTAIMAYNDFAAASVVLHLQALGLRVPDDMSVVGFDHASPSWYKGPALTTCAVPIEEIGAEAARMTYWRIEHPNAIRRKLVLETKLIAGKSSGPLAGVPAT